MRINHDLLVGSSRSGWEKLQNILLNVKPNSDLEDAFYDGVREQVFWLRLLVTNWNL